MPRWYYAPLVPTLELIDHIKTHHRDTYSKEMPDLIALACKVETVHAADPNTPHGLTDAPKSDVRRARGPNGR